MSQGDKSHYWNKLKDLGVEFERHYREYTTEELKQSYEAVAGMQESVEPPASPQQQVPEEEPAPRGFFGLQPEPEPEPAPQPAPQPKHALVPRGPKNPDTMAGEQPLTKPIDEPVRIDEDGLIWYQEEVRKPAYPKPRGRRVLKYNDPGTKQVTVKAGEYTETFEVAGDRVRTSEVKITLPSYQVGIYKDPRFPFKIYVYQDKRGFAREEVEEYYGGPERVPEECKRSYVGNALCYDIRTVVRAIEEEYRRLQLQGRI